MQKFFSPEFWKKYSSSLIVFLILAVFFLFHAYLISKTLVFDAQGNIRTTVPGYGDIPFHLTEVTKFAYGPLGDLTDPIYYGQHLQYPFAINFLSGMLLRLTGLFSLSLFLPVYLFVAGSLFLLYFFYKRMLGARAIAVLVVLLFFLGGGLGGYAPLHDALQQRFSFSQFANDLTERNVSTIVKMDAAYPAQNIDFGAPMTMAFLQQRASFIGFFFVLLLLYFLWKMETSQNRRYSVFAAVAYGILPLCHMHSFIAASFVLFSFFVVKIFQKKYQQAKEFVWIVFFALVLAVPQIIFLTNAAHFVSGESSLLHFRFGFMSGAGLGAVQFPSAGGAFLSLLAYFHFLWLNFGVLLPAFFLALFFLFWKRKNVSAEWAEKRSQLFPFALSALFIFMAVMAIQFQPWDYDDNKLLVYFQLFALLPVFSVFLEFFKARRILLCSCLAVFSLLLGFSGVIDTLPRFILPTQVQPVIFDTHARALADFVRKHIPADVLILTGESFANPVSSLSGRPVYMGYPGWLWSHSVSYGGRENQLRAFYANPAKQTNIPKEFPFSYILVDDSVVHDFGADRQVFEKQFKKIFEDGQYALYQK